jgi:hypothetical protein
MLKLYKRIDGVLHYHEAWSTGECLVEHWGVVGDTGAVAEHTLLDGVSEEEMTARLLQPAIEKGFAPIGEEMTWLVVVYRTGPKSSRKDVSKRHAVEDRLNHVLGWTGCGACDGGSASGGTMEVACQVVDFEIAKRVIEANLAGTEFGDFVRVGEDDLDSIISAGRT